ncbi:MAG: FHIPEP family type III secretion protein, partial [Phycisphaerae bacterium]
RTKDTDVLTEYVRNALARSICQQWRTADRVIHAVTLDPAAEDLINAHIERTERGSFLTLPPAASNRLVAAIRNEVEAAAARSGGAQPVVLASPQVRPFVRRLIATALPAAPVLAFNEVVNGIEIKAHGMVVFSDESANVSA